MLRGVAATLICTIAAIFVSQSLPAAPELQWLLVMWSIGPLAAGVLIAATTRLPSTRRGRPDTAILVIAHALLAGAVIGQMWSSVVTHQACPELDGCGLEASSDSAPLTMFAWSIAFAVILVAVAATPACVRWDRNRDAGSTLDA